MGLKPNEFARREGSAVLWREEPLRAVWHFDQLVSKDSHTIDGRFECSVRVARHAGDRQILAEMFLGNGDSVTVEQVVQRLASALRTALGSLASDRSAIEIVDPVHHSTWLDPLRKAADAVAFASGLELLAPLQLQLHSPTLDRHKQREIAGARHRDDLQRATELFKQFQEMRQAAPELSAGQLLHRLGADDRGLAFQSLLLAESSQSCTTTLWAVAGPTLVQIDPRPTPPSIQLHPLPTDLGPLRSVQAATIDGTNVLLIGAQRGVMVVATSTPSPGTPGRRVAVETEGRVRAYLAPNLNSELGFNRAIVHRGELWASHGDAGLMRWQMDDPTAPRSTHPDRGARNLEALDNSRLIYSTSEGVIVREDDHEQPLEPGSSSAVGILPLPHRIAIVRETGQIQLIDRHTLRMADTLNRGAALRAAAAMPWQGDVRLLLATEQGPIDCIGMDDPLVTQYLSAHRGLKILSATTDIIAAVSPDRQRIVIWKNWDGQRPVGEIHITPQTRHRIADICFV